MYAALDAKIELCKEEIEAELFSDSRFYLRKFRYKLKQIIKNNNINKNSGMINSKEDILYDYMYQDISNERVSDNNER